MKKTTFCTLLIAALTGCSLFEEYPNERTEREPASTPIVVERQKEKEKQEPLVIRNVVLLPFHNKTPFQDQTLQNEIEEQVKKPFTKMKEFNLVDGSDFADLWGEDREVRLPDALARARAQGISGVLTGSIEDILITESGDEVGLFQTRTYRVTATVQLRLIDAQSGKQLYSRIAGANVEEDHTRFFGTRRLLSYDSERARGAVRQAITKAASNLEGALKRMNWVGRIAKVDLHRYYINSGELSGIRRGQLLKVYGPHTPVRDEKADVFIGLAPGPFKGLLRVVDYFGKDGAVAVIHSGAGFRPKDRVELYRPPGNE